MTEQEWLGNTDNNDDGDDIVRLGDAGAFSDADEAALLRAMMRHPAGKGLIGDAIRDTTEPDTDPVDDYQPILYIAGPMTGLADFNRPAFRVMADRLRRKGYRVVNPAELPGETLNNPWDWYMRRDLAELVKCDGIVLLPGWEQSKGARLEHHVAVTLGMTVTYPHEAEGLLQ
ncbi:hypothetical protein SEA_BOILGATE_50 [Mycobacterium phage Boilgate]|nr:hypothetical protein SEA_BOILGATE_50 [Mycobacterium phage Boilgate]